MPGDATTSRRHAPLTARSLACDQSGGVAIYVALIAAAMFGIIGLAIDASRAMIVHSEAQAAADAVALAAASQLDGTPGAIARADAAVANLVENDQRLAAAGASAVAIAGVRYLDGLPNDDTLQITDDFVTTDPLRARFVEVTTAPLSHLNTFLRAVGAAAPLNITRRAVAGCNQMLCRSQPLMICNPAEATSIGAPFDIDEWRGRQIRFLHQGGPNAAWAPGNFGYLSAGGTGVPVLVNALASTNGANVCYGQGVTTEPGAKNGARSALNVRFGIYERPQFNNGDANNPVYAPDVNVRAMPQDLVFTGPANRFGNGRWNCDAYWDSNFGGSGVAQPSACTTNTSGFTRYAMYQYEIANGLVDEPGPGGVTGIPPRGAANALPDRRIVYVAVVNCRDESVAGRVTVPPITYLRVFLTQPVTEPSGVEIIGEVLDVVQVGQDDAVLFDIVQLYR
jgi:Flp pilus assembly protein TadG